jgi:hypothetical protein
VNESKGFSRGPWRTVWRTVWRALWRVLRGVLLTFAAALLFFEEWGWRPLTAWAARLARWPRLARLEARIGTLGPRWALALFLLPSLLLLPVKLLALWFIQHGQATLGLVVIVAAKLLGTALVGRLFVLTEPQLMQFAWFARALGWWRVTKERVRAAVQASAAWRGARAMRRWLTVRVRAWLRRSAR